jgi:DNA ligase-1
MRYLKLAELYEELYKTGSTLAKTRLLADFLKKVSSNELPEVIMLLRGKAFPEYESKVIGLGVRLAIKAIASASGNSTDKIEKMWKKIGDLGEVAEESLKDRKQVTLFSQKITTGKVVQNLQKLAILEGKGTVDRKISLLKELLVSAEPVSAKYIVRTCLEDLRVGAGAGVIRDAIAQAFDVEKKMVQHAYDLSTDFGEVASLAKENKLKGGRIKIGKPIKVMLYQKVKDIEDGFRVVGKPAACELKIDGFRMQIHKRNNKIWLFTRRLEDVTRQFPDIVEVVSKRIKGDSFVIDCEVVGIDPKTKYWLPFQNISQRIRRKYRIEEMVKNLPVHVVAFDMMSYEGKDMISEPFKERRKLLAEIIRPAKEIEIVEQIVTDNVDRVEKFMKHSLAGGNEGIMMKKLDAVYKPGSRVGYGVKVKQIMETLDLVIVGAEWGHGKRGGWLSSFKLACKKNKEFLSIGKMGTGIKEKKEEGISFGEFTKLLKPLIIDEKGGKVKVKPKVVVEVAYEEIQASPSYKSGYALRFPRLVRLRDDKGPSDADSLERVKRLYNKQRGRK